MRAVFDANVVVSGAAWRGPSYIGLYYAAQRRVIPYATVAILLEIDEAVRAVGRRQPFPVDPWPVVAWFKGYARIVDPAPLGKRRSRDPKDDEYLGCALVAKAEYIVTRDRDLLSLVRPFGIRIVSPSEFVALVRD